MPNESPYYVLLIERIDSSSTQRETNGIRLLADNDRAYSIRNGYVRLSSSVTLCSLLWLNAAF